MLMDKYLISLLVSTSYKKIQNKNIVYNQNNQNKIYNQNKNIVYNQNKNENNTQHNQNKNENYQNILNNTFEIDNDTMFMLLGL
jgi:hypothetical protein